MRASAVPCQLSNNRLEKLPRKLAREGSVQVLHPSRGTPVQVLHRDAAGIPPDREIVVGGVPSIRQPTDGTERAQTSR